MRYFAREYGIEWVTISPGYSRSNGMAERACQQAKSILKKAHNLKCNYLDLLVEYRANPIPTLGYSPSEMLLGRTIRTKIPVCTRKLQPINYTKSHYQINKKLKHNQATSKSYYDKTAKPEEKFEPGDKIMIFEKDKWTSRCYFKKIKGAQVLLSFKRRPYCP